MFKRRFADIAFVNRVAEIELMIENGFEQRTVFGKDGIEQRREQIFNEFAADELFVQIVYRRYHTQTIGGVVGVLEKVILAIFDFLFLAENRLDGFCGFVERNFHTHRMSGHNECSDICN